MTPTRRTPKEAAIWKYVRGEIDDLVNTAKIYNSDPTNKTWDIPRQSRRAIVSKKLRPLLKKLAILGGSAATAAMLYAAFKKNPAVAEKIVSVENAVSKGLPAAEKTSLQKLEAIVNPLLGRAVATGKYVKEYASIAYEAGRPIAIARVRNARKTASNVYTSGKNAAFAGAGYVRNTAPGMYANLKVRSGTAGKHVWNYGAAKYANGATYYHETLRPLVRSKASNAAGWARARKNNTVLPALRASRTHARNQVRRAHKHLQNGGYYKAAQNFARSLDLNPQGITKAAASAKK